MIVSTSLNALLSSPIAEVGQAMTAMQNYVAQKLQEQEVPVVIPDVIETKAE